MRIDRDLLVWETLNRGMGIIRYLRGYDPSLGRVDETITSSLLLFPDTFLPFISTCVVWNDIILLLASRAGGSWLVPWHLLVPTLAARHPGQIPRQPCSSVKNVKNVKNVKLSTM